MTEGEERPLVEVLTFTSMDEMYAWMRAAREEANKGLHPAQRAVTWGSHWVRFHGDLVEFGKVATMGEVATGEMDEGADPDEAAETLMQIERAHQDGSMWGLAYSVLGPEGTWGFTHQALMWPVEERVFKAAKAVNWVPLDTPEWCRVLLAEARAAWHGHIKAQVKGEH